MFSRAPYGNHQSKLQAWMERIAIVLTILATVAFQVWTLRTTNSEWPKIKGHQEDYYNLLSRGFLSGHLSLKTNPDPALLKLADPYDPSKRAGVKILHDVSFYHGKYYLYWGPAPALTLFLPFRSLTHNDLPQCYGNLLFVIGGFLALTVLWLSLRRDFFPRSGVITAIIGVLALGFCGMTLSLVRRPSLWEIPIAAGYAYAMIGLLLIYCGLRSEARKWWWTSASLAFGLAIASRPTYIVGIASLFLLLAWARARTVWANGNRPWKNSGWWQDLLALGVPVGAVVLGLLYYNYARFEHPFEFGLKYQLSGANEIAATHFSWRYAPFNAFIYYLAPAQWGAYFPFVQLIHSRNQPVGYYGTEYVYGLLVNEPITIFALLLPLSLWKRIDLERNHLRTVLGVVAMFFLGTGSVLLCFWAGTQRYMADFAPALVLLGCSGLLSVERWLKSCSRGLNTLGLGCAFTLSIFSIFFGACVSFQLHGLFKYFSPNIYSSLGHALDWPAYRVEKWRQNQYGPIELDLKFPVGQTGKIEPLVSTGFDFFSDQVFVYYIDDHHLKIGFEHLSRGGQASQPIEIDYQKVHHLRVELGSLFPPVEHPFFDHKTEFEQKFLTDRLSILLDDNIIVEGRQAFYDSAPNAVEIGWTDKTVGYGSKFSGSIIQVKRGQYKAAAETLNRFGAIKLQIHFPSDAEGRADPVVATGVAGKADTLFVRYIRNGVVRFGYDHWGVGSSEGEDILVDTQHSHVLQVFMPSLFDPQDCPAAFSDRIMLLLDNKIVWDQQIASYPVNAIDTSIGQNFAGSSVCGATFSGLIGLVRRESTAALAPQGRISGGDLRIIFPADRLGRREPIFLRGVPGAADILSVHYLDRAHLSFGLDHWGAPLMESAPIAIDLQRIYSLQVSFSPPTTASDGQSKGALNLKLNGQEVWTVQCPLYPAESQSFALGSNLIGASTCDRTFSGIMLSSGTPGDPRLLPPLH